MKRKIHISEALEILELNSQYIRHVSEWAREMGYSRSHFSRCFKKEFGLNPKDYIKDIRYKEITQEIVKDPTAKGYKIARNCGFDNGKSLDKYLSFNFNLCLSVIRKDINEKAQIGDSSYLNFQRTKNIINHPIEDNNRNKKFEEIEKMDLTKMKVESLNDLENVNTEGGLIMFAGRLKKIAEFVEAAESFWSFGEDLVNGYKNCIN